MRSTVITALFALSLLSAPASAQVSAQTAAAQNSPPTSPASSGAGGVTRDQYVHRAEERAGQRAGALFDRMDADHDGVLDRAEMRAWRTQHPRGTRTSTDRPPPQ